MYSYQIYLDSWKFNYLLYPNMVCHTNYHHFVQALKSKFLYNIEDEEFYFLKPLWMQKYVMNEK